MVDEKRQPSPAPLQMIFPNDVVLWEFRCRSIYRKFCFLDGGYTDEVNFKEVVYFSSRGLKAVTIKL